jgi:type 1 glutamine amidotransferase
MRIVAFLVASFAIPGGAQTPAKSTRPPDSHHIRTAVSGLLGWRVAAPTTAFRDVSFLEAASEADNLGLAYVEGFDTQRVSPAISRPLDYHLSAFEIGEVKNRLAQLNVKMAAYHVTALTPDDNGRKIFEFARSMGVETIFADPEPASLAAIDRLAGEFGINVALTAPTPGEFNSMVQGRTNRIGASVDFTRWKPFRLSVALPLLQDRLFAVQLGGESANARDFLLEVARMTPPVAEAPNQCGNCSRVSAPARPIIVTLNPKASEIASFEKAARPAMALRVEQSVKQLPNAGPDRVPAAERSAIESTASRLAASRPKKSRKLLVIDLCPGGAYYHASIADANLALAAWARSTGAFTPVFSNDLANLKYPKIKDYDAVFLNNAEGEIFADPDVIAGLVRFVRDGGGLAGLHGAISAAADVPEYSDLIGAEDGPRREGKATVQVDDPTSPLTRHFAASDLARSSGGREFVWTDEFYQFSPDGLYSRDKLHVLLSVDAPKSDWGGPRIRQDNDYALAWIHRDGRGRVFVCALGHTPELFTNAATAQFLLAGIQYVLGDLEADTTPSSRLRR